MPRTGRHRSSRSYESLTRQNSSSDWIVTRLTPSLCLFLIVTFFLPFHSWKYILQLLEYIYARADLILEHVLLNLLNHTLIHYFNIFSFAYLFVGYFDFAFLFIIRVY